MPGTVGPQKGRRVRSKRKKKGHEKKSAWHSTKKRKMPGVQVEGLDVQLRNETNYVAMKLRDKMGKEVDVKLIHQPTNVLINLITFKKSQLTDITEGQAKYSDEILQDAAAGAVTDLVACAATITDGINKIPMILTTSGAYRHKNDIPKSVEDYKKPRTGGGYPDVSQYSLMAGPVRAAPPIWAYRTSDRNGVNEYFVTGEGIIAVVPGAASSIWAVAQATGGSPQPMPDTVTLATQVIQPVTQLGSNPTDKPVFLGSNTTDKPVFLGIDTPTPVPAPANAATTLSCADILAKSTDVTFACPKLPPDPPKSKVEIVLTVATSTQVPQSTVSPGSQATSSTVSPQAPQASASFTVPLSKDDKGVWIGFSANGADWIAVEIQGKKLKYTRKGAKQVEVDVTSDGDKKYKFTGGTVTYTGEDPFASGMDHALVIGLAVGGGVLALILLIVGIVLLRKRASSAASMNILGSDNTSFDATGYGSSTYE